MQQFLDRIHQAREQDRVADIRRLASRASGCLAVFRLLHSGDALDEAEEVLAELEAGLDQMTNSASRSTDESIARRRRMPDTFSPLSHPNGKEPR